MSNVVEFRRNVECTNAFGTNLGDKGPGGPLPMKCVVAVYCEFMEIRDEMVNILAIEINQIQVDELNSSATKP